VGPWRRTPLCAVPQRGSQAGRSKRCGAPGPLRHVLGYRPLIPLIFHWGGPGHGEVDEVPAQSLASSVLVYDGPRWFGVYERSEPIQMQGTSHGAAEM
jgi:hypothetical protein